ncbi:MAG TPA: 50S ribosomal protein L19 [Bacteroidia bacterium]|nr:50S ribosomal protein L19 [Sphingobacteriales bacterium]HPD65202.1 50S ribosomal protein L19 [Bacteroidia bacterium]HRS58581.1 50S ribosomal protein L19 [Bacteroidia bacterium]HRU68424.1 50S ribosomal protein L19 [Bacteroidia bacterium]
MHRLVRFSHSKFVRDDIPDFREGDTVVVNYRIIEGNKERIQPFQGIVIQKKGEFETGTFTVRKISSGIGVERIFPVNSPKIESIVVKKRGFVRKARIYYLRGLKGKKAKVREQKGYLTESE